MSYTIIKNYLTQNDCYKKGTKRSRTAGIVRHSTGCNNPNLKRYVPNTALFGASGANHWDKPGIAKAVHFMIGKDKDGRVAIVQTLPLDMRCWGCGSGSRGTYNDSHIQYEILEDDHTDGAYYAAAIAAADWLDAYLLKLYNLAPGSIVSHKEAYKAGYATNHSDPEGWMRVFGDSMSASRARVEKILQASMITPTPAPTPAPVPDTVLIAPKYEAARDKDPALAGSYKVVNVSTSLRVRSGAGTDKPVVDKLGPGDIVKCYGYYTDNGGRWYLISYKKAGVSIIGYVYSTYLKRI